MSDSDSAVGVIIHTSFRYLHRVAAGSLRESGRSIEVIYRANFRLLGTS